MRYENAYRGFEFHDGLQPEEFLYWVCTIEEVLDFKGFLRKKVFH